MSRASHVHHEKAVLWFDNLKQGDRLGFCRATQQAFLRLLTNTFVTQQVPVSNKDAIRGYQELRHDSRIIWMDEPDGIEAKWLSFAEVATASPKIWMDAYLAAFAVMSGARLITFDRDFRVFRGLDWFDPSRGR